MDKVRTVKLYGVLGAKFGRCHRIVCNSTHEAMRALCVLIPGFERFIYSSDLKYAVFIGKTNIGQDELGYPPGRDEIRIAPMIQGSKRGGLFQLVTGVVLTAVGIYTGNANLALFGAALALGGIAQMLSPVSKGLNSSDSADNKPSYSFSGPVNTTAQGNPVPVLYGEMIVGSAVISSGIYAEDQQ